MTPQEAEFGTPGWFQIVGEEVKNGVGRNPPAPDVKISFLERYHGVEPFSRDVMRGLRVEIHGSDVTFRTGVAASEIADVVIDADFEAVRVLATTPLGEDYDRTLQEYTANGDFRVQGDFGKFGVWIEGVHDAVCRRTLRS